MRKPKIIERKLGRERAWGQASFGSRPKIEVDPRLSARRHLEVMCHEALHHAMPHLTDHPAKSLEYRQGEAEVDRIGKVVSDALWRASYRKVVLHSKHTTPVRITPTRNPKPRKK